MLQATIVGKGVIGLGPKNSLACHIAGYDVVNEWHQTGQTYITEI